MKHAHAAVLQKVGVPTKTAERLQYRVEYLEDLRNLQSAVAENGNEPLIPGNRSRRN